MSKISALDISFTQSSKTGRFAETRRLACPRHTGPQPNLSDYAIKPILHHLRFVSYSSCSDSVPCSDSVHPEGTLGKPTRSFVMLASSPSPTLHSSSSSPSSLTLFARTQYDSAGHPRHGQSSSKSRLSPRTPRETPLSHTSSRSSSARGAAHTSADTLTDSPRERPRQMVDAATQYSPQGVPSAQISSTRPGPEPPHPGLVHDQLPGAPALAPKSLEQFRADAASPTSAALKRNTSDVALPDAPTEPTLETEQSAKRARPMQSAKLMPMQYQYCNPTDLAVLIASMLMELIQNNDNIPLRDGHLTRFHSRAPPTISVSDYLQRLTTHATLSPPILLSMVSYIDRLCALYPAFTISSLTVHRFLITAATVASKGLSDSFWTNRTYARVGGVKLQELALLELEFLWRVEWRIVPRPEVLNDYYRSLVDRNDGYEIDVTGQLEVEPVVGEGMQVRAGR